MEKNIANMINIYWVLFHLGIEPDRHPSGVDVVETCPSCKETHDDVLIGEKWNTALCWKCDVHNYPVDFVMWKNNCSEEDAIKWIYDLVRERYIG